MSSADTPTIGELFLVLREMGFTEDQIQAAVQAGHFSVPEAAEWLLQGEYPRHTLVQRSSQPAETAFAAFNPPKETPSSSGTQTAGPSFVLRPVQPCTSSSEPLPIESRIKQDKSNFEEQQRQRVVQEARAERQKKIQERELVLKRIAEDRRSQQEKMQTSTSTETSPPADQGQSLGGRIQTNVDNNCILMIRLPSGVSMRERFPADAPLRSVMEHITERHPSLPPFSLLQGFPRKRFGDAELACSLHSLGLTPNATLCIQTTPPETPQDVQSPADSPAAGVNVPTPVDVSPQPHVHVVEDAEGQDLILPPPLPNQIWEEAVNYAGIPGAAPSISGPSHIWGRGQRLAPGDADEAADVAADIEGEEELEEELPPILNGAQRLPFFPENRVRTEFRPRHQWPMEGNRLRDDPEADPVEAENAGGRMAPNVAAAAAAAAERLHRAAELEVPHASHASQRHPSPPKRPFKSSSVPTLCALATHATLHLMTIPSMQYSSSFAGLTPELAELHLSHMSRERLLRPRSLEYFFGCPLQNFVLNSYPYTTNELLRQIGAFTTLKHLSLLNSPLITDTGVSHLSSLVKLQYLNLAACNKLTDSCLQYIAGFKSLCFLFLDQTKVTDAGMVLYLQSVPPCLSQLSLNQTAVTEATLVALPLCVPQLRNLSIKKTKIMDVSALSQLSTLQTLNLDGTNVTENTLVHLAFHPALSSLSLAGIPLEDVNKAFQIISGLKLSQLTLPGRHSVTDSSLLSLSRLSLLLELDLTDYTQVTDQGVSHLSSMTRLRKLSLSNTQLTDGGLPFLRGLQEMQELCLDRTAVTSRGVSDLITGLPHLQELGLANTHVGDSVVRRGLIHCVELVKVNLSRTRITDRGLNYLRHMHLAHVNLDATGVTLAGIANLLSSSNISSIRASYTRTIPLEDVSDEEP